jgi:hypothetical protein
MDRAIGLYVQTLIQARFPGGLAQFTEDGGLIGVAPGAREELLVYHPDLSAALREAIAQVADKAKLLPRFVTTLNFQGQDIDDVQVRFIREHPAIVKDLGVEGDVVFGLSPLFNDVTIINENLPACTGDAIVKRMRDALPGCVRTYVRYGGGKVARHDYALEWEPRGAAKVVPEASARTTVIGDDDLLNLRIALETARSVEELIAGL